MKKQYYVQERVGKARYVLNHHDGETTNPDGSPAWGLSTYRSKRGLQAAIKILRKQGYLERQEAQWEEARAKALADETKEAIGAALAQRQHYPTLEWVWVRPANLNDRAAACLVDGGARSTALRQGNPNRYFPADKSAEEILEALEALNSELSPETARLQALINNGQAWRLEGAIGRAAIRAIENGEALLGWSAHTDAYGNRIPSRDEVQGGTKGSFQFVAESVGDSYALAVASIA